MIIADTSIAHSVIADMSVTRTGRIDLTQILRPASLRASEHIRCKTLLTPNAQTTGTPGWHFHTASCNAVAGNLTSLFIACTLFSSNRQATQHAVHCISYIAVHCYLFPALLFNHDLKGGRSFTLQNTFLSMTSPCFLIT